MERLINETLAKCGEVLSGFLVIPRIDELMQEIAESFRTLVRRYKESEVELDARDAPQVEYDLLDKQYAAMCRNLLTSKVPNFMPGWLLFWQTSYLDKVRGEMVQLDSWQGAVDECPFLEYL